MAQMSYEKAKDIRGSSFASLMADQLMGGSGVGKSFSNTWSMKSQARTKGMKQAFDPLNIAKFMTGGSSLGPALMGKLLGRSKSDIKFFSGKGGKSRNSASKIDALMGETSANDLLPILYDIEKLLKMTSYKENEASEKEQELKEGIEDKKARRHKALLAAITGKPVAESMAEPTVEKLPDEDPTLLDRLLSVLEDKLFGKIYDKILGKFPKLAPLYEVLTGTALPLAGVYAVLLAPWLLNAYQRSEIEKDPNNPEWKDTPYAKVVRGEAKTQGAAAAQNQRNVIKQVSPQYAKDLLAAKPEFTDAELVDETGKTRTELKEWLSTNPKSNLKNDAKATPVMEQKSQAPTAAAEPTAPPPVEVANNGEVLNKVQKENLDVNLPESKPDPSSLVTNSVREVDARTASKQPIPSVRNMDETFQRMLLDSTRVV